MNKLNTPTVRKTLTRSIAAALVFAAAASSSFALVSPAAAADRQATSAQLDNQTNYLESHLYSPGWSGAYYGYASPTLPGHVRSHHAR